MIVPVKPKSPFFVVDEFISPLACEDIITRLDNKLPNKSDGVTISSFKGNKLSELRLLPHFRELVPALEEYYDFVYGGLQTLEFEWYPEGCKSQKPRCENSVLVKHKWVRTNDKDFAGIIFLNDYRDTPPFDSYFEVVGGKLQFPNHNFSFVPKRGTLVMFPGSPHFVNHTENVKYGDLNQIRFYITCDAGKNYVYDPKKFPGTYKDWFPQQ